MHVTVVGAGFGGTKTALELAKDPSVKITLISNDEYLQYYPTLYRTATGHDSRQSWVPLKEIFSNTPNVKLVHDTITRINPAAKTITGTSGHAYHYAKIVFALGSTTTYFGIEGLDTYSHGIKSEKEIRQLQRHLFEQMGDQHLIEKRYVIIGGGPTGVELAASLGQYLERLRRHFKLPKRKIHITLIEAAPRILSRCHETTSRKATAKLKEIGVKVECDKHVQAETADAIIVSGKPLSTQTVIWTAGVATVPFYKENAQHFTLTKRGQVQTNDYLEAMDNVYVIGDNAATKYAGLAQTALHDAKFVAKDIKRVAAKQPRKHYVPLRPATVIPVGERWAAFEYGPLRLYGFPARLLRSAADIVGYNDLLPLKKALSIWRSGSRTTLRLPDDI